MTAPSVSSYIIIINVSLFLSTLTSSSSSYISISNQMGKCGEGGSQLKCQLEEANPKLSRLESLLEETILDLSAKSLNLKDSQKLIEVMKYEMERLQLEFSSLKGKSSYAHKRVHQLEEEVRLLWVTLRKSNFEIHLLEAKVQDADDRLDSVTSRVETMAAVITEQWIQIQQLEQALHIAQMRASKAKRAVIFKRCKFLKFVGNLWGNSPRKLMGMLDSFLCDKESTIGSYLSQALTHLEEIFLAVKQYHHELQGFVKQEMQRNQFTASLAHKEVVFFVASIVFTFPIMGAWLLLSSNFS